MSPTVALDVFFPTLLALISTEIHHPVFTVTGSSTGSLCSSDSGLVEDGMTEPEPIHILLHSTAPLEVFFFKGRTLFI